MPEKNPTACLLVIGNEVLSGRTQDANIRFLATGLGEIGIPLREVRVIPDVPETIVGTVNEVRAKFDYVFTTAASARRTTTSPASASQPPSACRGNRIRKRGRAWSAATSQASSMPRASAWRRCRAGPR